MKLYFCAILLMLQGFVAQANDQESKDWIWNIEGDDVLYAGTENKEGRAFGQYCFSVDQHCYYLVTLGISCKEGAEFPSILNSDAGVVAVKLICGQKEKLENVYYIKPFKRIDKLIRNSKNVGFVMAIEDQRFKVVRFSLAGAPYAIDMMRSAAKLKLGDKKEQKGKVKSEEYL